MEELAHKWVGRIFEMRTLKRLKRLFLTWKRRRIIPCPICLNKKTTKIGPLTGQFGVNDFRIKEVTFRCYCGECKRFFYIEYNRATGKFGKYIGVSELP